ncbi:cytoskeletal protein binding protein [Actinomortierella wolfii]|nr:cytoskeletal protein binding protein [Actinomortierella wolfii]
MPFLKVVVALYDYEANTEEELTIKENNVLYVLEDDDPEWWKAKLKTEDPNENKIGLIPSNYIEPLPEIGSVVGLYKYEATNEEELTFDEGDVLVLYEQDDPDWFLVGNGTNVGFVPGNYVEVTAGQETQQAAQDAQEYGADQPGYDDQQQQSHEDDYNHDAISTPAITVSAAPATNDAPPEKDDLKFWSVNSPVRQWSIKDVEKVRVEKKHVYLDLGGAQPASFDFSAASKADAEAIFNKIQESKQKSRISRPATSTAGASATPSIRDSIISTSTYQTAPGSPHLAPAPQPEEAPDVGYDTSDNVQPQEAYQEQIPVVACEGRWAIAMYDFQAENEEELTVRENEEVWVTDYVSSDEWWRCQVDDRVGIVPASYLRWADEADPNMEQQADAEPVPEEEAHSVPVTPVPVPAAASIPVPPPQPAAVRAEEAAPKAPKEASTPAPAPAAAPAVAKPKNTRVWTDRTGTFKVEAEFLGYHDGKISLHKLNGVKIAVPVSKMSVEDVQYVEKVTGQKIVDDSVFDWYDFFIKAGIATEDALRYSTVFRTEKMDASILPELTRDVLKGLNVKEGDIIRIRKAAGTGTSSPASAEGSGNTTPKPKKSVSFATQESNVDEDNDRDLAMRLQAEEVTQARNMHLSYSEQRRQQELLDEQYARELQERENASNRTPVFGKKKDETPQRKVSRPKPSSSASASVDVSKFSKIGSMLASTPSSSSSTTSKKSSTSSKTSAPAQKNNPHTDPNLGFDDDAWEVREVMERTAKFDYDNWKVQNRENEDEWIAKFAASTAPKEPEPEPEKPAEAKAKTPEPTQPAGRPRPKAPERTESDNSLGSLNLVAPLTPTAAPSTPPPAKPSTPVPGSLEAMKLTQEEEAEKVRQQMQKIKEKQESDRVKKELEQVKAQQQMLHNALLQQATQNQQLVNHIRRMAPPPPPPRAVAVQPTGTGALPPPLVPVNPTGPLRFVPTHPTGQTSRPNPPQPTFSTASMGLPPVQQAMATGVAPQMTGVTAQPTGRANWANATPENPFGMGAVAVNGPAAPRAPQGIIAARSAPPVPPQPFANRSAPGPPPPIPAPMQTSMATGMMQNQMTGVSAPTTSAPSLNALRANNLNANMTGVAGTFQSPAMTGMNAVRPMQTGFQGNNMMSSGTPSTSVPFQTPMMTGMSMASLQPTSQPSFQGASTIGNNLTMNQMMNNSLNNNNNSNLTSTAQFQSPMLTGMQQVRPMQTGIGGMGNLNNNNNNNTLGNMGSMNSMSGGLNSNPTGLGGVSGSMTGLGNNQFSKPSMMGASSPSALSSGTFSNINNSRILQTSSPAPSFGGLSGNNLTSNNTLGTSSPMPLTAQPTGHLPMASSYMRPPPGGSLGGLGNVSPNIGTMGNQSMTGQMGQMGQMGMMNTGLGGMGSMSSGMSGSTLMPQMTGVPMGNMGMNAQQMGGMGMNSQVTGMAGLNGVNSNMGGGMGMNNNNLNNGGQFNRW